MASMEERSCYKPDNIMTSLAISQPQAGETVVVSGAAGAVGSLVGQIAKGRSHLERKMEVNGLLMDS